MTTVANIRTLERSYPEWRNDPGYVYIGRYSRKYKLAQSKWHNPYSMKDYSLQERRKVIRQFEAYLRYRFALVQELPSLEDKILVCHCAPQACHGDVLCNWQNVQANLRLCYQTNYSYRQKWQAFMQAMQEPETSKDLGKVVHAFQKLKIGA